MTSTSSQHHKTGFKLTFLLLVPALAALVVYFWLDHHRQDSNASQQLTVAVTRGDLRQEVSATGRLQPRTQVEVGAQVSGQLIRLHVEIGDEIEAGQLLAEIDAQVLEAQVESSRAQLRAQHAQLEERNAQLLLAQFQQRRQQLLWQERATSEEAVQEAETQLQSARSQVAVLKAQIEQNQSGLRADEANLEYTRILAPMSGTVVSLAASQGQTLNANQQAPTLLELADLSVMTVVTQVSEADVSALQPGMAARFTTLGARNRFWQGQLERIQPTPEIENNVVLYNALFDVDNPRRELLPQMTTQVFFTVAEATDVLLLPMSAVITSGRDHQVRLLEANGQETLRSVQLGVSDRIQVEILSGLNEGDQVLLPRTSTERTPASQQRMPRL